MNKDYLKKLIQDLKIGNPHHNITEKEWKVWAKREYSTYTDDDLKLVACHTMYNEEDNISQTIINDLKISDLDAIHILDGAWRHGGKSPSSTDRSLSIIKEMQRALDIPIILESHPEGKYWESEGDKRNYQLDRVAELYPGRTYALIIDCDEELHSNNGRLDNFWFKGSLSKWYPDIALFTAYAHNSSLGGDTPRIIPVGKGIHYYTEKTMVLHDKDHNIIVDYNCDVGEINLCRVTQEPFKVFNFESYRLINSWNIRNNERMKLKHEFDLERVKQFDTEEACRYE